MQHLGASRRRDMIARCRSALSPYDIWGDDKPALGPDMHHILLGRDCSECLRFQTTLEQIRESCTGRGAFAQLEEAL